MQEYGVCEEAILSELPNAQADKSLPTEGLTMLEKEHEWGIVKYKSKRKADYGLVVLVIHEGLPKFLATEYEVLARGFKTSGEAMQILKLFKE